MAALILGESVIGLRAVCGEEGTGLGGAGAGFAAGGLGFAVADFGAAGAGEFCAMAGTGSVAMRHAARAKPVARAQCSRRRLGERARCRSYRGRCSFRMRPYPITQRDEVGAGLRQRPDFVGIRRVADAGNLDQIRPPF